MTKNSTKFPIDLNVSDSREELGNNFRKYPQIFKSPDDIEDFINEREINVPVLKNILKLRKEKKLGLTATESEFYFSVFFDYIYDVYRVPVEQTYIDTTKWLAEYLEQRLVHGGLNDLKRDAIQTSVRQYLRDIEFDKFFKEENIVRPERTKLVNYHTEIGDVKYSTFYNSTKSTCIESFWIKSDSYSAQPVDMGDESYMRVHVYPEKVYIHGCDDCSYTLYTKTQEEAIEFATFLKSASPVWNFCYTSIIHEKLEFTN